MARLHNKYIRKKSLSITSATWSQVVCVVPSGCDVDVDMFGDSEV